MWMSLRWNESRALLPIGAVWEVRRNERPTPVPGGRADLDGVIVRRDLAVPVFDPRRWEGFFKTPPGESGHYVVIVSIEDCMDGIRAHEADIVWEVEESGAAGADCGLGPAFAERVVWSRNAAYGVLSLRHLAGVMHHGII
jgi:chemotaxis signal transduction protein